MHMGSVKKFEIDPKFEEEFPDLAKKIRRAGLGVYKTHHRKKDMLGFPLWRLQHFDTQISGYMRDSPKHPYTREALIKATEKKLRSFRQGQREIKNMTVEQRVAQVGNILQENWSWAADRGLTFNNWIHGYHASGDHATRLHDHIGVWLWGIGQVCDVEHKRGDHRDFSEILIENIKLPGDPQ